MGSYLGLLLFSLMFTVWVACRAGKAGEVVGMARHVTEGAFYLFGLPVALFVLGTEAIVKLGAVVLVFGGVYLAHRAIFAVARWRRNARRAAGRRYR